MDRAGRVRWLAVAAVAGALAALWVVDLGRPDLWTDEALTLRFSDSWEAATSDFHPPASYAAFLGWRLVVPDDVAVLRLLSALLSLGGVACWGLFWLRRARAGDVPVAAVTVAIVLTAASPHALLYGRMVRYHALAGVLVAVAVASWWAATTSRRRWVLVATSGAVAALGLTSYPAAASVVVALTAFVVLRRRDFLVAHAVAMTSGIAAAGVVVTVSDLAAAPPAEVGSLGRIAVSAAFPLWSATVGETVDLFDLAIVVPAVAGWAALAFGALRAMRQGTDVVLLGVLLVVAGIVGTVAGGALIELEHTASQSPKLFAPFAPALYLVAGVGFAGLAGAGRRVLAGAALAGIAVAWVPGIVHLHTGDDFLYPSYALPWGEVADTLAPIVASEAASGGSVGVVTVDPAFSFVADHRDLAADVYEVAPGSTRAIETRASRRDDYDVVIVVDRQRVNEELDTLLDDIQGTLRQNGYSVEAELGFGTVSGRLRDLQERFAGRQLDDVLVTLRVFGRERP